MAEANATYEGWGVLELFGHSREVGFISTQYFGDKALFRVDVPSLPEGAERELTRPEWESGELLPAGTKVKTKAVEGRTRFIGPGALYALNPCTEEVARKTLERATSREIQVVSMGLKPALPQVVVDTYEPSDDGMDDEEENDEITAF